MMPVAKKAKQTPPSDGPLACLEQTVAGTRAQQQQGNGRKDERDEEQEEQPLGSRVDWEGEARDELHEDRGRNDGSGAENGEKGHAAVGLRSLSL
eukprot:CAMPEP_0185414208 /NCGR_PEP_ID=MMETSP1365-20130426/5604_1 /TAXON_ID=38817 /ORGANISM="Gephyrocapsa oceanica, Strain RCC1303" /LENGTH=94 /DNA_ID=CAMNT_0028017179 /DNA_START=380 /DNA_END=666 /DNA_ORIENTATION=+